MISYPTSRYKFLPSVYVYQLDFLMLAFIYFYISIYSLFTFTLSVHQVDESIKCYIDDDLLTIEIFKSQAEAQTQHSDGSGHSVDSCIGDSVGMAAELSRRLLPAVLLRCFAASETGREKRRDNKFSDHQLDKTQTKTTGLTGDQRQQRGNV